MVYQVSNGLHECAISQLSGRRATAAPFSPRAKRSARTIKYTDSYYTANMQYDMAALGCQAEERAAIFSIETLLHFVPINIIYFRQEVSTSLHWKRLVGGRSGMVCSKLRILRAGQRRLPCSLFGGEGGYPDVSDLLVYNRVNSCYSDRKSIKRHGPPRTRAAYLRPVQVLGDHYSVLLHERSSIWHIESKL